ncbi:MAG: transglutaminase domain-containing protein [Bacteroidota bacterium]
MNKVVKTIGLIGLLLILVLGMRFIAGSAEPDSREHNYAREKVEATEKEGKPARSKSLGVQVKSKSFRAIDRFARDATESDGRNLKAMAQYLASGCETDLEKARAIYVWLTKNISYDDVGYNVGNYDAYEADEVFQVRKTVCGGFSNLFQAMGEEMGLEIQTVSGYAKGFAFANGETLNEPNHAWNIIKIDGKWRIFDATWGEGNGVNVNGQLISKKQFDDYWFDVDPYEAIFTHFPENPSLAFVEPVISLTEYGQLPYIRNSYFKLGFDGETTYRKVLSNPDLVFPETFGIHSNVKVISAPTSGKLEVGKSYPFILESASARNVAGITNEADWESFKQEGKRFELRYFVKEVGKLAITVQERGTGNSYSYILQYQLVDQSL